MVHGSLFSGIGGFDLASQWMGWQNAFNCELDPFCQKILKYYWSNTISYGDIKSTNFTIWEGRVDIISGGFPCQPYSNAGKRLGSQDSRDLWPEMCRAIQEIKPTYIVGENVRGLINWNRGLVFEKVCSELEDNGYEIQPILLSAASVGASHKRERIFFIAYSDRNRLQRCLSTNINKEKQSKGKSFKEYISVFGKRLSFEGFPTQSPVCGGDDGLPTELDGITFSKWRQESVKAYGNAIVAPLAYEIFKVIQELENSK